MCFALVGSEYSNAKDILGAFGKSALVEFVPHENGAHAFITAVTFGHSLDVGRGTRK